MMLSEQQSALEATIPARLLEAIETNTRIDWFSSPAEFAAALTSMHYTEEMVSKGYAGAKKATKETAEAMLRGRKDLAKKAEAIISKIDVGGILSKGYAGHSLDVCGAFPCTPAAIIGAPESMFRPVIKTLENTPITVVVDSGLAAIHNPNEVARVGAAILAFVVGLSAHRPVELIITTSNGSFPYNNKRVGMRVPAVKLPTSPLELPVIAFCLGDSQFERGLSYPWTSQSTMTGWGFGVSCTERLYVPVVRKALGLAQHDIFFAAASLTGMGDEVDWVNDQLAEHLIEYQNAE